MVNYKEKTLITISKKNHSKLKVLQESIKKKVGFKPTYAEMIDMLVDHAEDIINVKGGLK
jgi:hypothetical protein